MKQMFAQPFNFALQRTNVQALGWYLFFTLMGFLFGVVVGLGWLLFAPIEIGTWAEGVKLGVQRGTIIAPIFPIVVGGMVAMTRRLDAANAVMALLALAASFTVGWLFAGIFIAWLTTRPPRNAPGNKLPHVFD